MEINTIKQGWAWARDFIKQTGRAERVFPIKKEKTALIVIDMQNAFMTTGSWLEAPSFRDIVPSVNSLTRACRNADIPVIWVLSKFRSAEEWGLILTFEPSSPVGDDRKSPAEEMKWGSDGVKIWSGLEVDEDKDHEIVKCRYSAFIPGSSNLERLLRTLDRDNLIITGGATNVCVAATVMDAMMLDFKVTVASDACAAFNDLLQEVFLMNFKMTCADVVSTEMLLEELASS